MASLPSLDLVPSKVQGLHDRRRLLDSQEGVRRPFVLVGTLYENACDHGSNCCLFVIDGHAATSIGRQHDEAEEDDDRQRDNAQTDEMIICRRYVVIAHEAAPPPRT
jgi:hypothetical protein